MTDMVLTRWDAYRQQRENDEMRRKRLILAALCCNAAAGDADTLGTRAMRFEQHWNLFIRRLAGCPDLGDTTPAACGAARVTDYAEFLAARKAAMRLFDLIPAPANTPRSCGQYPQGTSPEVERR